MRGDLFRHDDLTAGRYVIRAEWATESHADGFYVTERFGEHNNAVVYGPMPDHCVAPLIEERRQYFEALRDRLLPNSLT